MTIMGVSRRESILKVGRNGSEKEGDRRVITAFCGGMDTEEGGEEVDEERGNKHCCRSGSQRCRGASEVLGAFF